MLNTDLHTPNLKPEARMSLDDFIRNLRGIDDCGDLDRDMLVGIYDRVKSSEFRPGSDHVTQVGVTIIVFFNLTYDICKHKCFSGRFKKKVFKNIVTGSIHEV